MTDEELKEYKRAYYLKNREKILSRLRNRTQEQVDKSYARRKELWHRDPRKGLISLAKKRAKVKNLDFNLSADDVQIPEKCPVLGIPLVVGNKHFTDNSPTLDRLDNTLGYTKENVIVMSYLANRMKNSATLEQLLKFANWVLLNKEKLY